MKQFARFISPLRKRRSRTCANASRPHGGPDKETVNDASQGVQLATMQKLARYWATDYDWREAEAKLNSYPQFITNIDGLDLRRATHLVE